MKEPQSIIDHIDPETIQELQNKIQEVTESSSNDLDERARRMGVPVIPKLPPELPPRGPNPVVAICGECGADIHQNSSFVCPNRRCPIQPKVSC